MRMENIFVFFRTNHVLIISVFRFVSNDFYSYSHKVLYTIKLLPYFCIFEKYETLNGRLPPEDGPVRPQTLGKLVSDDPRHFIFRRRTKTFRQNFLKKIIVGKLFVLARGHICLGWRTYPSWLEDISVPARGHICLG